MFCDVSAAFINPKSKSVITIAGILRLTKTTLSAKNILHRNTLHENCVCRHNSSISTTSFSSSKLMYAIQNYLIGTAILSDNFTLDKISKGKLSLE